MKLIARMPHPKDAQALRFSEKPTQAPRAVTVDAQTTISIVSQVEM